jgi:hypothetical protein
MNRRSFFAVLLAPLVARFVPKPKLKTGTGTLFNPTENVYQQWEEARVKIIEMWPRDNPWIYFMETVSREEFCERYPPWKPEHLAAPLAVVANPSNVEHSIAEINRMPERCIRINSNLERL